MDHRYGKGPTELSKKLSELAAHDLGRPKQVGISQSVGGVRHAVASAFQPKVECPMTTEPPTSRRHAADPSSTNTDGGPTVDGSMVKVVYFDEQSASDFLDISQGGSAVTVREQMQERATKAHASVQTTIAARLSWLPFIGGSAEVGGGFDASRVGQTMLSKTLSNTILTDYLAASTGDGQIERMDGYTVTAPRASMSQIKMFTPYLIAAKDMDADVDLARLDEALERAKGYYELIATKAGDDPGRRVLRFNIGAFRNNYGLADLSKMRLVFHAIRVGQTTEEGLTMDAELDGFGKQDPQPKTGVDIGRSRDVADTSGGQTSPTLDVYDVLLAGVDHGV